MNRSLSGFSWLVIPLAFILFTAPGAISYVFFHPDEKYMPMALFDCAAGNKTCSGS